MTFFGALFDGACIADLPRFGQKGGNAAISA